MVILDYIASAYRHREIVAALVWRDFLTRYKQAVLGLAWALIYPLTMTLILWLAFAVLQGRRDAEGLPWLLLFYSGLHPFNLFTSAAIYATISIVANAGLVTKVRVPCEAFPLSAVLSALFDFAFGSIAYMALILFYWAEVTINWNVLWLVPVILFELVFTLAVSQLLAAACVIARDLRYGTPILCQLALFLVPVIYPVERIPQALQPAYLYLNPLAVFVDSFRRCTVQGLPPRGLAFLVAGLGSCAIFWISCRLFRNAQLKFADLV